MNKRLQQFLNAENISQSQFAESIGVAKASVSHILAGRNKPGFDFIEGMARRYPNLNLEWLISGRGRMYKAPGSSEVLENRDFTDTPPVQEQISTPEEATLFPESAEPSDIQEPRSPSPHITKILVFYSDGTYKEIL